MVQRRRGSWQRRLVVALLAFGVLGYFGYHAFNGNYGIYARELLDARVAELNRELQGVQAERRALERRVALLRPQSLDPDILEERAREVLNLAHPNDVMILERPENRPRR